jgi:hypothetical protein
MVSEAFGVRGMGEPLRHHPEHFDWKPTVRFPPQMAIDLSLRPCPLMGGRSRSRNDRNGAANGLAPSGRRTLQSSHREEGLATGLSGAVAGGHLSVGASVPGSFVGGPKLGSDTDCLPLGR